MGRKTIEIVLSRKDRAELEAIVADGNTRQKIAKRARIVLLTAEGTGVMAIMRQVEVSKTSVWRWQERFAEAGVAGLLKGKSKKPGKAPIADDIKRKVIETAVKERPANATHWSLRMLGAEIGISHTSVQRILGEHGLKPHLTRTFKFSERSPSFWPRRCRISSGSTSIRPTRRWCCASTRRARFRPLIARNPVCP